MLITVNDICLCRFFVWGFQQDFFNDILNPFDGWQVVYHYNSSQGKGFNGKLEGHVLIELPGCFARLMDGFRYL
ncbi:hypothetical protein BMS3Abin14_01640 [bacterium BMS3Abin14]|nr:hypothetical protein BMS3Abin14_01640 [bacterium BMS3Abin14]